VGKQVAIAGRSLASGLISDPVDVLGVGSAAAEELTLQQIVLARSMKSLIEAADAVADGVLDTVTSP
jgi:hypothetical protein